MNEQVLAFPADCLPAVFQDKKIVFDRAATINRLGKVFNNAEFLDRELAEKDPSWKQIIPYVILFQDENVFTYRRAGGEKRLKGKLTLGIGGHINPVDSPADCPGTTYAANMFSYENCFFRELFEETGILLKNFESCADSIVGMIHDDSNEVGSVHFGIVHFVQLGPDDVIKADSSIGDPLFRSIEEVKNSDELEGWSKLVVSKL